MMMAEWTVASRARRTATAFTIFICFSFLFHPWKGLLLYSHTALIKNEVSSSQSGIVDLRPETTAFHQFAFDGLPQSLPFLLAALQVVGGSLIDIVPAAGSRFVAEGGDGIGQFRPRWAFGSECFFF
jgi:hypothetical protein